MVSADVQSIGIAKQQQIMTPKFTHGPPVRQYGKLGEPKIDSGLLSLRLDSYRTFMEHGLAQSI